MSTEILRPEVVERPMAVATQNQQSPADASPEWQQTLREAEKLAVSTLTPGHLKVQAPPFRPNDPENDQKRRAAWNQTVANCILVANQARKWGADVFSVAAESYVVQNKLGYQGKLIAAVVNARGSLTTALKAMYSTGTGDAFAAVIYGSKSVDFGTLSAEERKEIFAMLGKYADAQDQAANRGLAERDILTIRVSVGQCKTDNKMWKSDPEQKLWYTGATKWARRHAPELMVGILSDDDLDRMQKEQRISQTAEQQRISTLIPSSLETSPIGIQTDTNGQAATDLPLTEAEKALPSNPPTADEQAAAHEQVRRETEALDQPVAPQGAQQSDLAAAMKADLDAGIAGRPAREGFKVLGEFNKAIDQAKADGKLSTEEHLRLYNHAFALRQGYSSK